MGEYLKLFKIIQEDVYNDNFQSAILKLKTFLNVINEDYKKCKSSTEKEKLASTIKYFLPALDSLKRNELSEEAIAILKLDKKRLFSKNDIDVVEDFKEDIIEEIPVAIEEKIEEKEERVVNNSLAKEKNEFMPLSFDNYIGQEKAKQTLKIAISAAKKENRALNHLLICSSYGIGKTTLANIVANEMGLPFIEINASSLKDSKALLKFFEGITSSCIIFIDEIHNLSNDNQTILLSILTQYRFSTIDKNGNSKTVELPSFTLIGASTQIGELLKPFINRFTILELQDYTEDEQMQIVKSKFDSIEFSYTDEAAVDIAKRSRGIPRNMETFIKGIKDLCLSLDTTCVNEDITRSYFEMYDIDEKGLYARDRKILEILSMQEKPIGLTTLESKVGIQKEDIAYRYEPYLLKIGFIEKTEKGRVITDLGREYLESSK